MRGLTPQVQQIVQKTIRAQEASSAETKPFFVADLTKVEEMYEQWTVELPRVKPYYAVKCNLDRELIQTLDSLGAGFDCASINEIQHVINLDISPSRILFSNPIKSPASLRYAREVGVQILTFDNSDELSKIRTHYPKALLLFRILVNDHASVTPLGSKFGATICSAGKLLRQAVDLNLQIVGVTFHVGSGSMDPDAWAEAIKEALPVFELVAMNDIHGPPLKILNIGGGFTPENFPLATERIRARLKASVPDDVEIFAEPGRLFASHAFTLTAQVIGKRSQDEATSHDCGTGRLYLNDGVYGNFMNAVFEKPSYQPIAVVKAYDTYPQIGQGEFVYSLWGPTCDSSDCISKSVVFDRDVQVGDWLVFENMGAYTDACQTKFNGFGESAATQYLPVSR
ncbi:Ornithine decarboxylase [Lachnellula suecica]|uniref:ornithine decarboxylase n=1 Tax=Lachnellula suecica TaxID=602035 RepID=A0A8T9BSQ2_9HELO|nr:Ornithine decarboxylase [Lachnellula suecica]